MSGAFPITISLFPVIIDLINDMHRQATSNWVDSIPCVHDISLIGLRSISHAQKDFHLILLHATLK